MGRWTSRKSAQLTVPSLSVATVPALPAFFSAMAHMPTLWLRRVPTVECRPEIGRWPLCHSDVLRGNNDNTDDDNDDKNTRRYKHKKNT